MTGDELGVAAQRVRDGQVAAAVAEALEAAACALETAAWADEGPYARDAAALVRSFAPAVTVTPAPAPRTPCPEGFHWIGQSLEHCDRCGLPAWVHAGLSEPRDNNNPFSRLPDDEYWVLRPWKSGEAAAIRRKWDPDYDETRDAATEGRSA